MAAKVSLNQLPNSLVVSGNNPLGNLTINTGSNVRNVTVMENLLQYWDKEDLLDCITNTTDYINAYQIAEVINYIPNLKDLIDEGEGSYLLRRLYLEKELK